MSSEREHCLFATILMMACILVCEGGPVTLSCPNGAILSNYQTFQANVNYIMTFSFNSSIPAMSIVQVQFPSDYSISNSTLTGCLYSTANTSSYSSTFCYAAYDSASNTYSIYMPNIYTLGATSQSYLSLQFNITNPWAATSETVTAFIGSTASGSCILTYFPSVMNSCSYSSVSAITGASANHTVSFIPSVQLLANSYLQITVPTFLPGVTTVSGTLGCTGVNNSDGGLSCSNSVSGYTQLFNISGFVTSNKTLSTAIVMTLGLIRNYWSLASYSPITYQLFLNGLQTQNCTGMSKSATALGSPLSVSTILANNTNISTTYSNRSLTFSVRNPFLMSSGQLQITYSTGVSLTYTSALGTAVVSANTITLTGVTAADFSGPTSKILLTSAFSIKTPPSSRPFTFTYTTYNVSGGIPYGIESFSTIVYCSTGTLTAASLNASSQAVNAVTKYVISFTTANALTTGSYIGITFPAYTAINNASTCSCNNVNVTCSVSSSSYANLTLSGAVTARTALVVTFNSVTNPNQAMITSSFTIHTYYDSGLDSVVDKVTSGLTLTSVANQIVSMVVTPASNVTYALTSYTISCTLADPIPVGGSISITFPSTVTLGNLSLTSASFTNTNCTLTVSSNVVTISGCLTVAVTNLTISMVFANIYNPPSLQPTSSFIMYTYGPVGQINFINTSVTITMTTPATSSAFTVSTLSQTVHAITQYTFSVTAVVPRTAGNYFILTIPNTMAFSGHVCSSVSGVGNVSCVLSNTTSLVVTLVLTPNSLTVVIAISSIRNYDISSTAVPFQLFFYSANDYMMEATPIRSLTYNSDTLTTVTVNNNDQIALYQNSNITLTVTSPFAIDSNFNVSATALAITPPVGFTVSANTSCISSVGICSVNGSNIIATAVGLGLNSATFTIMNILLPYINISSTSFSLSFQYGTLPIATMNTGVTVSPYCSSPCKRCVSTQTYCASCLPSPNTAVYLYTVNNTCLTSCPNGYYPNVSLICYPCNPPCAQCLDSVNCTKCIGNYWLYGYSCLTVCPATYYNDTTGYCLSCVSPCGNCTTLTSCTSCIINFYSNFSCVNASSCPSGTYGDTVSRVCAPCASPCVTCFNTTLNCTSCISTLLYYSNSCLSSCPSLMYNSSNSCVSCLAPCGNCTSATYCLSCISLYLSSGGQCVNASNCPLGTYPDSITMKCATCPTGCAICSLSSNCSSCTTNFFFYSYQCLSSCPNSTYQSGSSCIPCSSNCATCQISSTQCTSCNSPDLLDVSSCVSNCPNGTYVSSLSCVACASSCLVCTDASTCSSCSSGYFLSGSQCITSCPLGTYQSYSPNTCSACSVNCLTCSVSSTNCTSCSSSLLYYSNTCVATCPSNYFNVSGRCQTCSNCNNCSSAVLCQTCLSGYYMLNGVCYGSCPSSSIPNLSTYSCTVCDSSCLTCSTSLTSCDSCKGGLYLLNSACVSQCPGGYKADPVSGSCLKSLLGSIVYFPTLISFCIWFLMVIYSKHQFALTEAITCLCGGLSLISLISWIILTATATSATSDSTPTAVNIIMSLGIQAILASVIIGIAFNIWLRRVVFKDSGFCEWVEHTDYNLYSFRIICWLSLVSFPVFRLLYSRLYGRRNFSCFLTQGAQFLQISRNASIIFLLATIAPMIFICGYVIYLESTYSQTLLSAIDCLILSILLLLLLILDIVGKDSNYFDTMIEDQPYLKHFRYEQVENSYSSMRSIGDTPDRSRPRRYRTQLDAREEQEFFRKNVHFIDNVNKFGHLNDALPESVLSERKVKTLPNDLESYPQLQQNEDEIVVINDDLFFEKEEERRRRQEEEQEERRREEEERRHREQLQREEQERLRRKKLMQEDAEDQQNIEFPDIVAIDRVENKAELKKNPTSILNQFKKVDDKAIPEKARKKLQEAAKKNGLNADFMSDTFGVEKHHNPELLNAIIDIHNHVNRDAVKQVFSSSSNPEVLQELFAKNSTMNPERLRELMNDEGSRQMVSALMDKEKGVVSADVAKLLLDSNSKYSSEFVKELLGGESGMAAEKVQELLRDNPDKAAREATLQAMRKLGGDQLQNKELLSNLLGEESVLEPSSFLRVAKELPKEVVQRLFGSRSATNDVVIQKILNNKKINLKSMSTILQDPELLQQLAEVLSSGNEVVQQNLINLFMNGQQLDAQLLSEMISNPVLMQKLLQRPVDPAFLGAVLGKEAKTDMKLLQEAVGRMSEEQLGEVFQFNPQKNINMSKVAQLFESNSKTDPELIAALLTPEVLTSVYSKSSAVKGEMLNRLVQKGKSIDVDSIVKIYGEERPMHGELEQEKKYNVTDNNFNLKKEDVLGEMQGEAKGNSNGMSGMSRTAGGMMGFLSPIHVGQGRKGQKGRNRANGSIDDISDEGVTIYNEDEEHEQQSDSESEENSGRGKKGRRRAKKKKPLEDIRLPSQKIYLQRLQAPHELERNKNLRRKKKKVVNKLGDAMDEDNQVYDLDF